MRLAADQLKGETIGNLPADADRCSRFRCLSQPTEHSTNGQPPSACEESAHPLLLDRLDRHWILAFKKPFSKLKPKTNQPVSDQAVQPGPVPPDRARVLLTTNKLNPFLMQCGIPVPRSLTGDIVFANAPG